jgi:hypothetical protein
MKDDLNFGLEKLRELGSGKSAPPVERAKSGQTAKVVPENSGRSGISFSVDNVEPAPKPLWLSTLGEALEVRSGASILIMPDQNLPALASEGYVNEGSRAAFDHPKFVPPNRVLRKGISLSDPSTFTKGWADRWHFDHPLIEAVHEAFSTHRPLALSPDAIWLTIVEGFAHHLKENAETFRGRVVSHHGKKELRVETLSLDEGEWPGIISQLSEQIRENSDPFLYENLSCEFSTTTPTIRTAMHIALMDGYQRYFSYESMCVCGIPKINLEGTPEDWQRIRERIEVLASFDLGWWMNRLAPIVDQLIATAKGAPDLAFWQAIYKPEKVYAAELATGWISDLFPYVGKEPPLRRNPDLGVERIEWLPQKTAANQRPGISLGTFPSGISRAPVKVTYPDDSAIPIELLGGFFGVSQAPEDGALAPIINWAVVKEANRVPAALRRYEDLDASLREKLEKHAIFMPRPRPN